MLTIIVEKTVYCRQEVKLKFFPIIVYKINITNIYVIHIY